LKNLKHSGPKNQIFQNEADNTQLHSQARKKAERAWQLPNIICNRSKETGEIICN